MPPRRQRARMCKKKKARLFIALRELYGDFCCYCNGLMSFDEDDCVNNADHARSLEHIVDYFKDKRNPDTLENLLLAHRQCNSIVGARKFTLEQKEYYIANPKEFVRKYLCE